MGVGRRGGGVRMVCGLFVGGVCEFGGEGDGRSGVLK